MEPIWEAFNMLFFLLETSLTCIMTILRHGPLDTMPILRLDYFSTGANMRQALLATSLLWDMSFFLQQPLWDMTILRHDIFPTATIMRHDHFETWHFSYSNHYDTWPFRDMVLLLLHNMIWEKVSFHIRCAQQSAIIVMDYLFTTMTFLRHDHIAKIDLLRRNHFEIQTICNNNLFETWSVCNNNLFETWHFWDMICLQQ